MLLSGFGLLSACNTTAAPTGSVAQASSGNRPTWAVPANLVGRVAADERITVQVQLALRNQTAADAELADISNPDSANYGHYLSDDEFNAKYAPTADDVAAIQAHLQSAGMTVKFVPGNRAFVSAEGTAVQLEKAFSTQLGLYKAGDAVKRAPITTIAIPPALQSRISSVMGLFQPTEYGPKAVHRGALRRASAAAMVKAKNPHPHADATDGSGNTCSEWYGQVPDTTDPVYPGYAPLTYAPCGYKPGHVRAGYGFTDIVRKGNDGKGQSIAIVDAFLSPTLLSDAQTYAFNNDPDYPMRASQLVTVWAPGTTQTPDTGWYGEQTLDVEAAHAMAPGAKIVAVAAQSAYDQDLIAAINMVVDQKLGSVISNSYGMVEQGGYVDFLAWKPVLTQAGLKGIGVYFSSGDNGDESSGGFYPPSADFPASSDLVTAVGGTSLALGQTGDRIFEAGWETGASFLDAAVVTDGGVETTPPTWDPAPPGFFVFGAGGGYSSVFEQPTWQKNVVPGSLATVAGVARRAVPDVGMLADPFTGFIVGQTDPDLGTYSEYAIGGTSLACPLFAATVVLAQQHAKKHFGFANPLFYKHASAFRDIAPLSPPQAVALPLGDGTNAAIPFDFADQAIQTLPGWDAVTGLGAPNGKAFLDAIK
jgi:subtilase family serine protease